MEIDNRNRVLRRFDSEIAASPKLLSGFHPTTCHPQAECFVVMVTSIATLSVRRSAELTRPYDQRFIKHPTLLQVSDQSENWLIDGFAIVSQCALNIAVVIPRPLRDFDESHTGFGHRGCLA